MIQRMRRMALAAVVSFSTLSCAQPPAAPEFTQADRDAIAQVFGEALAIANGSQDWEAYDNIYYAEDASVYMEGMPTLRGRQAITAASSQWTGMRNFQARQVEVEGAGDLAYVYGDASAEMPGEDGSYATVTFRFIEIWKRQADGSWKVVHDISNSDVQPGT